MMQILWHTPHLGFLLFLDRISWPIARYGEISAISRKANIYMRELSTGYKGMRIFWHLVISLKTSRFQFSDESTISGKLYFCKNIASGAITQTRQHYE